MGNSPHGPRGRGHCHLSWVASPRKPTPSAPVTLTSPNRPNHRSPPHYPRPLLPPTLPLSLFCHRSCHRGPRTPCKCQSHLCNRACETSAPPCYGEGAHLSFRTWATGSPADEGIPAPQDCRIERRTSTDCHRPKYPGDRGADQVGRLQCVWGCFTTLSREKDLMGSE